MTAVTEQPNAAAPKAKVSTRALVIAGLVVSLALAIGLSLFASASPDGLEHVAETLGFAEAAQDSAVAGSPLADYGTSGVENTWLSTAIAGTVGLALTAAAGFGLARVLARPADAQRR